MAATKQEKARVYYQAVVRSPEGRVRRAEQNLRYKAERRALVDNLKRKPCMDCGGSFPPACMDFDHRDPETKVRGVAAMYDANLEALMAEIEKCDLVCANCHRIRTYRVAA